LRAGWLGNSDDNTTGLAAQMAYLLLSRSLGTLFFWHLLACSH